MTLDTEVSSHNRHLVVVFDICSSTTILEDLKRTDNLGAWRTLLIHLKDRMLERGANLKMSLYKFIGDGWVLLFPDNVPKIELCSFLCDLSQAFEAQFEEYVKPLLSQEPNPIGLMFGIDAGDLIRLELNGHFEYIGRAINVASRLQSYTKELPDGPSNKVIFSKNSFNSPAAPPTGLVAERIKVSLRNISPATMECFALQAYQAKRGQPTILGTAPPVKSSYTAPSEAVQAGPNINVTDLHTVQIAALGGVGKWTAHKSGQVGVVVQFTNAAPRGAQNAGATAKAFLIYQFEGKEKLRVKGSWLDGYDLARFNVNDSHGLIVGISVNNELCAVETVRTSGTGPERIETRLVHFNPAPSRLDVLVQLTDADGGVVLYEGQFAISTNPLTVTPGPRG
jgi:class 3 adenylate cyclase